MNAFKPLRWASLYEIVYFFTVDRVLDANLIFVVRRVSFSEGCSIFPIFADRMAHIFPTPASSL